MSFQTFAEVIEGVIAYHQQAGKYYRELTAHTEGDLKLLLEEDLAQQQFAQADDLQTYCGDAEEKLLKTELQFARTEDLWQAPERDTADGELTLSDVQSITQTIDNTILDLYQQLQQEQLPPNLAEIIDRMAEQQKTVAKKHTFTMQQQEGI